MPVPTPLDESKAAIAGGKALPICGEGVSTAVAGEAAKAWKGLIESAIDEAPKKPGEDWSATCKTILSPKIPLCGSAQQGKAQEECGGFTDPRYRRCLGELALRRDDLDGEKTHLEAARVIYVLVWVGDSGNANVLRSLGNPALFRDDLDGAKPQLEAARDIYVRIGDSLDEANALQFLGALALRCYDLDGAKTARYHVRIGESLGEANVLRSLGNLAHFRAVARPNWRRRGISMSGLATAMARRTRVNSSAVWRYGATIWMARRNNWRRRGISMSGLATAMARRTRVNSSAVWRYGATIWMARRNNWRRRGISMSGSAMGFDPARHVQSGGDVWRCGEKIDAQRCLGHCA
jgi:hypothetical protein